MKSAVGGARDGEGQGSEFKGLTLRCLLAPQVDQVSGQYSRGMDLRLDGDG